MKNILAALLSILVTIYGYSQKADPKKLPQAVADAFKKAHPNSTASWEWEDPNYEANFEESGKTMSCVVNKQGTILETETAVAAADLPVAARTYMNQHYRGKKWKEVTKIVKANGEVNYEVNAGRDILFDAEGHHLEKMEKKEKD